MEYYKGRMTRAEPFCCRVFPSTWHEVTLKTEGLRLLFLLFRFVFTRMPVSFLKERKFHCNSEAPGMGVGAEETLDECSDFSLP